MLDQFRDPLAVLSLILIGFAVFWMFTYVLFKGQEPGSFLLSLFIGIANLLPAWWLFDGHYLSYSEPVVKAGWFFGILIINIIFTNLVIVNVVKYDNKEKKEIIDMLLARVVVVCCGISVFFLVVFFAQKILRP